MGEAAKRWRLRAALALVGSLLGGPACDPPRRSR